jgi:hypothetical protein
LQALTPHATEMIYFCSAKGATILANNTQSSTLHMQASESHAVVYDFAMRTGIEH